VRSGTNISRQASLAKREKQARKIVVRRGRGQKLESKGLFAVTLSSGGGKRGVVGGEAVCYQACVKRARVFRGRLTIPDILVALRMR